MLVIIGLIIGGVLVGQNLIAAAEVRAQITQIEKYQTAVNTFRSKFNAIPGDMRPEIAQQFGFIAGSGCIGNNPGLRNGDGLIDGWAMVSGWEYMQYGETGLFWQDLSGSASGNLIEGQFPGGNGAAITCNSPGITWSITPGVANYVGNYMPLAKIGHGQFIYVYEYNGTNWYELSAVTGTDANANPLASANLTVLQAYNIDKKTDDGIPTTGNIQALYLNGPANRSSPIPAPNTTTSGGTSSSCYDTTTSTYSITVNNGSGANCALSFKFQ